jgi:hypothetical protein
VSKAKSELVADFSEQNLERFLALLGRGPIEFLADDGQG